MVGFPLLLIPLAIYNCVAFLMPTVSFTEPLFKLTLMSGAEWPVTLSDVLLALGMVLLLLEVIKGARPGAKFLTDHLLSFIVFGAAAAEFVLWPKFGTSTFLLLTLLSLVDFLSGVSLRTRRRVVAVYEEVPSRRAAKAPPARAAIRSRAARPRRRKTAAGTGGGVGGRIRAARSSRAEPCATRGTCRSRRLRRPPLLRPRWPRRAFSRPMTRTRRRTSRRTD